MNNVGTNGNYWWSSPKPGNADNAYNLNFNSGEVNVNNNNRNNGYVAGSRTGGAQWFRQPRKLTEKVIERQQLHTASMHITHEQLLADVFQAYYDARRHKRNTASQLRFEMNLEANLVALTEAIETGSYKPGRSVCFIVTKPVKREVFAADFRDRVVHHLLYNYLSPMFERTFIEDCYSCRTGKGTLYGIRRTLHHMRSCSHNFTRKAYILKIDIRGYFMSIDRRQLLGILNATLDRYAQRRCDAEGRHWVECIDYDMVKRLMAVIVMNDPTVGCLVKGNRHEWDDLPKDKSLFTAREGCGLPIGNLTSQLFSNVYLTRFDHWMKRRCRQRWYGRYVDDMMVVGRSRRTLAWLIRDVERFLHVSYGLVLHPHKRILQPVTYGINVLGMHLRRGVLLPGRRVAHNMRMAVNDYLVDALRHPFLTIIRHDRARLNSYLGMIWHSASLRLRLRVCHALFHSEPALLLVCGNMKKVSDNPSYRLADFMDNAADNRVHETFYHRKAG